MIIKSSQNNKEEGVHLCFADLLARGVKPRKDEKQSIILTEYTTSHGPGEIGADRDRKQNYEEQKQHDCEARS